MGISGEVVLGFGWVSGGFRRNAGLFLCVEWWVELQVTWVRLGKELWRISGVFWALVCWEKERRRSGVSGWLPEKKMVTLSLGILSGNPPLSSGIHSPSSPLFFS